MLVAFGDWQEAYDLAKDFVAQLTTAEKFDVIVGSDVSSANWTGLLFKDSGQSIWG